jgi:DNA-binding response OmpR family regulator
MRKRILVCEPDRDVRALLELSVEKLGYEAVQSEFDVVDAIVLEPGCAVAQARLRRFGADAPPVVCVSIHPPEADLAPPGTVDYLMKPVRRDRLDAALRLALAA